MLDTGLIAQILLMDLPSSIRGFTVSNSDDTYTIVLNAHHTLEMHQETVCHEMAHIRCNDFRRNVEVNALEWIRHEGA